MSMTYWLTDYFA